jgi:hypothetical protein
MGDLHDAERNEPMHVDDSPELAADHIIKDGGDSTRDSCVSQF